MDTTANLITLIFAGVFFGFFVTVGLVFYVIDECWPRRDYGTGENEYLVSRTPSKTRKLFKKNSKDSNYTEVNI